MASFLASFLKIEAAWAGPLLEEALMVVVGMLLAGQLVFLLASPALSIAVLFLVLLFSSALIRFIWRGGLVSLFLLCSDALFCKSEICHLQHARHSQSPCTQPSSSFHFPG